MDCGVGRPFALSASVADAGQLVGRWWWRRWRRRSRRARSAGRSRDWKERGVLPSGENWRPSSPGWPTASLMGSPPAIGLQPQLRCFGVLVEIHGCHGVAPAICRRARRRSSPGASCASCPRRSWDASPPRDLDLSLGARRLGLARWSERRRARTICRRMSSSDRATRSQVSTARPGAPSFVGFSEGKVYNCEACSR